MQFAYDFTSFAKHSTQLETIALIQCIIGKLSKSPLVIGKLSDACLFADLNLQISGREIKSPCHHKSFSFRKAVPVV